MDTPQHPCPFAPGALVTWTKDAPKTWHFIHTPGPMKVVSAYWHHGRPSEYAKMFGPNGMEITPGWIIRVEYDADASDYRDPPLSLLIGSPTVQNDFHELWLTPVKKRRKSR
jgi:hypothetical protein